VSQVADETEARKGRPTPSRKEAEAARKKQMKTPMTRKEQAKRDRAAREEIRIRQREALKTGDERHLPLREQGPVRRFCRDYVDRRRNFAEYLLPFLIILLVLFAVAGNISDSATAILTAFVYPFLILGTLIDEVVMVRGLRKELKARFGADAVKGSSTYAVLRSTQLRRFRLPKPQVKRGETLSATYR
jgi:Flp pilus assembly protein TadB